MEISELNKLSLNMFVQLFANIFEHYPEAAAHVYTQRPFPDVSYLVNSFYNYMDTLPLNAKRQILVNHPVLGSKKSMTKESTNEQTSTGLNRLEDSEAQQLEDWNSKYLNKFGFPYIICVLETTKDNILSDIKKRYDNELMVETLRGLDEVKKIAKHRIFTLVDQ